MARPKKATKAPAKKLGRPKLGRPKGSKKLTDKSSKDTFFKIGSTYHFGFKNDALGISLATVRGINEREILIEYDREDSIVTIILSRESVDSAELITKEEN